MNRSPRLFALNAPAPKAYDLRVGAGLNSAVKVDREKGIIRDVAVMSAGPAKGYGFSIDQTTLSQVHALATSKRGGAVKVRLGHPASDAAGVVSGVGQLRNVRLEGSVLRGDVHLGTYAKSLPGGGNAWEYLLARAEEAPEDFGLSAVVHLDFEAGGAGGVPLARAKQIDAVDFVDDPAANRAGLLSSNPTENPVVPGIDPNSLSQKGASSMDEVLKAYLLSLGLNPQATLEQAKTFFVSLSTERQTAAPSQDKIPADWKPAPVTLAQKIEPTVIELETKRVSDIKLLCALYPGLPADFAQKQIALNVDLATVKTNALAAIATANPNPGAGRPGSILVGDDKKTASLAAALPDAIMLRAGVDHFYTFEADGRTKKDAKGKPVSREAHELAYKFQGLTLLGMYQHWLCAMGADQQEVFTLSRNQLAELLSPRKLRQKFQLAQSTSDFDNILADSLGKTLRQAYLDAPSTWNLWARRAQLPDYKAVKRNSLSESPNLVQLDEGGEIKYVALGDGKEQYAVVDYTGGIKLTRQAIVNDDLDAFSRIPTLQANAARRKEDDVAYAIITANAALADTGALFNSTAVTTTGGHANYTSSGTVISVTSMGVARKTMRVQKGPKNAAILNLTPRTLLVPAALETVAEQLIQSTVDPSKSNMTPNLRFINTLNLVVEPRLDADSATAWYLIADYNAIDTVEVGFLMDQPEPVLRQETDFDTEDQKYAVRHTVGAKAIDFRGMYKNVGA